MYHQTVQTARKQYECDLCTDPILPKTDYLKVSMIVSADPCAEGHWITARYHPLCYEVESAFISPETDN